MSRKYIKTRECGCVVRAVVCGYEHIDGRVMYLLGGHSHNVICNECKKKEDEEDEDTLYDMWTLDSITDGLELDGWIKG